MKINYSTQATLWTSKYSSLRANGGTFALRYRNRELLKAEFVISKSSYVLFLNNLWQKYLLGRRVCFKILFFIVLQLTFFVEKQPNDVLDYQLFVTDWRRRCIPKHGVPIFKPDGKRSGLLNWFFTTTLWVRRKWGRKLLGNSSRACFCMPIARNTKWLRVFTLWP